MENDTLAFLQQQIKFVPKKANPPCVASLRPIKDFWAALKKAVYDKGREATSQARKPPESLQSFSPNDSAPLQHYQGYAGHLRARWILGHLLLGLNLPTKNDKIYFFIFN